MKVLTPCVWGLWQLLNVCVYHLIFPEDMVSIITLNLSLSMFFAKRWNSSLAWLWDKTSVWVQLKLSWNPSYLRLFLFGLSSLSVSFIRSDLYHFLKNFPGFFNFFPNVCSSKLIFYSSIYFSEKLQIIYVFGKSHKICWYKLDNITGLLSFNTWNFLHSFLSFSRNKHWNGWY